MATLEIATLVLVMLMVVLALAHALELPGKLRLSREQYLAVQPIYYPGFTIAGAAEPLSIALLAALLALTPTETTAFWLTAGALLAAIVTHAIYWIFTAPVNKVWLKGRTLSAGAERFFAAGADVTETNWMALRDRWERSHVARAVGALIAFLLLSIALVAF